MEAAPIDPNDSNSTVLSMEVDLVTATDPKFWKWADQRLYATLGTSPTRSPVTSRGTTAQIDQSFWENMTKLMGSGTWTMLQAQPSQQIPTATIIAQVGCRYFFSDWAITALIGYVQVYTETGIPRIWGRFQIPKECVNNRQQLMEGMMYWANKNSIEIDIVVFFVKMEIEEMVNTNFNPGGNVLQVTRARKVVF